MKLSHKINYIILPVISTIFVIAGAISYYAQKEIVLESLTNKLEYHADSIITSLQSDLHELNSLSKQFINNSEVARYLNDDHSGFQTYAAERQLIQFIGNIATASNQAVQLEITDDAKNPVFFYNSQDPFAEYSSDPSLELHLSDFKSQLTPGHSSTVQPVNFQISLISEQKVYLTVYRTFSPEQSIYDNVFSLNSRIFTAKLSTVVDLNSRYLADIESSFGSSTSFNFIPSNKLIKNESIYHTDYLIDTDSAKLVANSPFGTATIQLNTNQIDRLYLRISSLLLVWY